MSLVKDILVALSTPFMEGKINLGDAGYHPYKLLYGDLKSTYKRESLDQALNRAKKRGFIKKSKIDGETYIYITEIGKQRLVKLGSKPDFNINPVEKDWDGKYRIVLFDIPENDRLMRDVLRSKLKDLGFVGWQKSVWVGKKDITEEFHKLIDKFNLGDQVGVVETSNLGNNKLESLLDNE